MAVGRLVAPIAAKLTCFRIVTDMAGLNDDQVLAVRRVRAMPVCGYTAAHDAVVEWECAKLLGDQDNRKALAFIGTECTRWHDFTGFHAEREAEIIQPGHKPAVAHHHSLQPEILKYCMETAHRRS